MDSERSEGWHERVEEVFHELRELPEPEWAPRLASLRGEDAELAEEVHRLLKASGGADTYLRALASKLRHVSGDALEKGERVGPYTILDEIGRGGMGRVYCAERTDGTFDQRVAIKILPESMGGPMHARFLAERRILARLEHPGISRMIDGGVTENGTTYFVMELVEGVPIDTWCEAREASLDQRIDLFLQVCDAVAYAHNNLVVHRDLKPSNILVDDSGRVRLLDFGIAKVLDPEEVDLEDPESLMSEITRVGGAPLTRGWASPEQLHGEPVTTASDVYALGCLLYLLVTRGERAHKLAGLTPTQVVQRVTLAEPTPPSRHSGARGVGPDLDAVVLQALGLDPESRYPTARHLADDLRRERRGQPVIARPQTWIYRASRFVRRHTAGSAAVAASVLLLVGLTAVSFEAARASEEYARNVSLERDRAEREAARAAQVSALLLSAFERADPGGTLGEAVTARDILNAGAEVARTDLVSDPDLRAGLLYNIAEVYRMMNVRSRALELSEEGMAALERVPDAAPDRWFDHQLQLALIRRGPEARERYRALHPQAEARYATDPVGLGIFFTRYARELNWSQDPELKAELFDRAIAILREHEGELARLSLANALITSCYGTGSQEPLEPCMARLEEGLDLRRSVLGPDHGLVSAVLSDMALALESTDPVASDTLLEQAVASHRAWGGEGHTTSITLLNNRAGVLRDLGRLDEAEAAFREALELRLLHQPDEPIPIAYAKHGLAQTLIEMGRPHEAIPYAEDVVAVFPPEDTRGRISRETLARAREGAARLEPQPEDRW